MTKRCKDVDRFLIEYYEDSLDPVERKEVEEHLADCEGCRRSLKEIEHVYGLLAKDSMPLPQEGFWVNFLPQVRARIEGGQRAGGTLLPKVRWSIGLVSILLVAIIGSLLLTTDKPTVVERETESMEEISLALLEPYSYADQLAEVLSSQDEASLPVELLVSNGGVRNLDLAEKLLEEDYIQQSDPNSILSELSLEELRQLEADLKALDISDIL